MNRRGKPQGTWVPRGSGQGRASPRDGPHFQPPQLHTPPGAGISGPSSNDFSGNKEYFSKGDMGNPQEPVPCRFSKPHGHKSSSSSEHQKELRWSQKKYAPSHAEELKEVCNSTESKEVNTKRLNCSVASESSHKEDSSSLSTLNLSQNLYEGVEKIQIGENRSKMTMSYKISLPSKPNAKDGPISIKSSVNSSGHPTPELSEHSSADAPFDLCPPKSGVPALKKSLFEQNREKRNALKQPTEVVLQPGMVLLKSYISLENQIEIVERCRNLGMGTGGFYQPGYRDGAKLNLKMMCLGKNWDPETSKYGEHRLHDRAKPPCIPVEFFQLVENALRDSRSLIEQNSKASNSSDILPDMSPDICIVNFYSSSGRLGLHQDRDESEQSLRKGLPVVSFSIGDAAEFLYGEQRNVETASKITLESGDVLIFGGKSRHIFHGVASIQPDTAPKTLLEKTNIRAGRLNLTFREY